MNSILMRNTEVVEQPIRLQHNLTQRLVNESVHFLEEHARNSSPFLLVISWVQVHCISLFRVATAQGKQGIWFLLFPDRENTGNFALAQGKILKHRENVFL